MVNKPARFGEIVHRTHCKHLVENVFGCSIVGDEIKLRLQFRWYKMDVEVHQARVRCFENIESGVIKTYTRSIKIPDRLRLPRSSLQPLS